MELRCHGVGNIVKLPDVRSLSNGTSVCNVRLAFNHRYKKNDEWQDEACFIEATAYGKKAETLGSLKVGTPVFIDGRLKMDSWKDKNGNGRISYGVNISKLEVCLKNGETKPITKSKRKSKPKEEEQEESIPDDVDDLEDLDDQVPF